MAAWVVVGEWVSGPFGLKLRFNLTRVYTDPGQPLAPIFHLHESLAEFLALDYIDCAALKQFTAGLCGPK
jgi:hypothetical protein